MRFKTTLFLIVALAVIAFLVFKFGDDPAPEPQAPGPLFPGLAFSSIDRIELGMFAGQRAVLERQAGRWKVVEPFVDEAKRSTIDQLVDALESNVKIELQTEGVEIDLVAKELNPPTRWIEIRHAGGTSRVNVGALDPLGAEVFVTVDGDEKLYRTGRNLLNFLELNPDNLRDERLFRADPLLVDQVLIERNGAVVMRAEKNRGKWKILEPIVDDADSGKVHNLVNSLARLEANRIALTGPAEQQIAECGLDDKPLRVVLKSDVIAWGVIMAPRSIGPAASVFCMREGGDQILTLKRSDFSRFEFDLDHYRSTTILPSVRENVTSVAVQRGEDQWLLLRREDKYFQIDVPFRAPADHIVDGDVTPVSLYMSRLFALQATAFVSQDSRAEDLASFGLENPEWTLFIRWDRGATHKKIEMRISAEKDGIRNAVVQDKPRYIYAIRSDDIAFIAEDPIFLRDRRIFDHDINSVIKATFTLGAVTHAIERPAPGKFFEGDTDNRFQELLHDLNREVVQNYLAEPSGASDSRFATVWGSVTYGIREPGTGLREITVEFGQETPEGYYGRSSDMTRGVFILNKDFLSRFTKAFDGL